MYVALNKEDLQILGHKKFSFVKQKNFLIIMN